MKRYILIILAILFACTQALAGDLVADLEKGTLGEVKVGQAFTGDEALDEAIGAKVGYVNEPFPEDMDDEVLYWDYLYSKEGISILVTEEAGSAEITDISLTIAEPDAPYNQYSKVFTGTITPEIPRDADRNKITGKFGKPDRVGEYPGASSLTYIKPYGELIFLFEEGKGLNSVSMSSKSEGT